MYVKNIYSQSSPYYFVLVMSNNLQKRESDPSSPRRPMTETQQIESILNLQDISQIQPDLSNEESQRRINKLEDDLKEALSDLQMKDKHLENAKKTQKTLEGFQEVYKKKIASLQEKLRSMEGKEAGRETSSIIDSKNQEFETKVKNLNEAVDKLKKENVLSSREVEKMKQKDFQRERELEELRGSKEDLSAKLKKAETSLLNQTKNSKNQQAKIKELEDKVKSLQGKAENTRVEIVKEVVVDHSAVDRLKEQNNKLSANLNKSKTQELTLRKELLELEKKQKKTDADLSQTTKGRQSLKQKVKDLEQIVRQLKRDSERAKKQEVQYTEVIVKERNILVEDDEDNQEQIEIINPAEKQTKKVLKAVFQKEHSSVEDKVKYLNSIIANAEMQLDNISI